MAKALNLLTIANLAEQYSVKWFASVRKTPDFLQLDYKHVLNIRFSSTLQTDSENEVFSAVYAWIKYDRISKKYARSLFLKVRYPLMSEYALK